MPIEQGPAAPPPGPSVPDHVPDELVARYGRQAGHAVRYRRSQRYRFAYRMRRAARPLADTSVWMLAVVIFFWMVIVAAIVGGLAYAIALRPWVGLYVVGPIVLLFGLSVVIALRLADREPEGRRSGEDGVIRLP